MSETFTEMLPVRLTDEEVQKKGEALAASLTTLAALREERKEAVAAMKGVERKTEEGIDDMRRAITDRSERRPVSCVERADVDAALWRAYRLDTDEQFRTRVMESNEVAERRQGSLFTLHQGGDLTPTADMTPDSLGAAPEPPAAATS